MTALRILPPDHYIGAVESIPLVVDADRAARETPAPSTASTSDLYFDVQPTRASARSSGLDARRDARDLRRARGRPRPRRQARPARRCCGRPSDRASPRGTPRSARGRPGWHVECAAIALRAPRQAFDIQGGGTRPGVPAPRDVGGRGARRPTGEAVRAGATCTPAWSATRARRCRSPRATWCSSRSCAPTGVDPMAIRLALLAHHYRSDWEWTDDDLDRRAGAGWRRWRGRCRAAPGRRAATTARRDARARCRRPGRAAARWPPSTPGRTRSDSAATTTGGAGHLALVARRRRAPRRRALSCAALDPVPDRALGPLVGRGGAGSARTRGRSRRRWPRAGRRCPAPPRATGRSRRRRRPRSASSSTPRSQASAVLGQVPSGTATSSRSSSGRSSASVALGQGGWAT